MKTLEISPVANLPQLVTSVLLRREGWPVGRNLVYRLYREDRFR